MKKAKNLLVRFLKSKVAVFLVLLGILGVGLTQAAKADGNYNFATVYQYYMLDNRADSLKNQGSESKVANVAPLGSGGVTGNFSYNEIVNSAPKGDGNKQAAEDFVSMMATYSAYKYFSNKVQGFESIVAYLGRALTMFILLPFSLAMDIVATLYPALLKILAKLNVIPLLGEALTNLSIKSGLMEAAGFNKTDVNNFINAMLAIACSFIVIALGMSLRRGGQNIDRKWWRKFKGRVFMVLCFPLVIGFGATLLNDIGDMAKDVPEMNSSFQKYLVDDRSWALKYNFAPQGNSSQQSDIKPGSKGFVDLKFDPYTRPGASRILQINKGSDVAGTDSIFPNTALLLAYGVGDSFSAADYINYQGSKASSGNTFGSYYSYANGFSEKQLLDVDKAYYPSGGASGVKDDQAGSYKSAIDDYKAGKDKKELNTSKQIAWRDRFIYGAKTAGALDKYYGDTPSQEMVKNQVGGLKARNVPSDQSMFLILSTIFNENGGRYYINAPARGIKSVQGLFDSNRSEYFTVSMVGNSFFTFVGLVGDPLITLTVLVAAITALFSIGLLDMNLRPLSSAGKGFVLGDIEYGGAFIIYSLGIAGTWILFVSLPTIIITVVQAVAKSVFTVPINLAGAHPSSPQQTLALNGIPIVLSGIVSIVFALMWLKSKKFRYLLNDLFTFVWNWAQAAADRLERQAAGQDASAAKRYAREGHKRNKVLKGMDRMDDLARNAGRAVLRAGLTRGLGIDSETAKDIIPSEHEEDPDSNAPIDSEHNGNDDDSEEPGSIKRPNNSQGSKSPEDIRRAGQFDRIHNALSNIGNSDDPEEEDQDYPLDTDNDIEESDKAIAAFRRDPTQDNLENAQERLMALRKHLVDSGAPQEQLDDVDKAITELNNIGDGYGLDPNRISDKAIESDNVEKRRNNDANNPNNINSDHEKPKTIDEATDNADKVLDDIQNDPRTSRDNIDHVLASENALDNFRTNPTPENLQAAQSSLEALKKQLIASGAPQDQINNVDKVIDGLNKVGVDNGLIQNPDNPVESNNLEPKVVANNANKALNDIQNDPRTSRDTIDNVLASESALNKFRTNPTPENLQVAQSRLETLKKQLIASGAPQSQINNVDKAINGLSKTEVNNDMPQNDGSFVESNNLEPNKAANNADNVLRHIRNDPRANGNTLDKVTASDEALFNFRNQPTPETLQAARSSLETLKKQLIASGAPQSQINNVDKAINGLSKTEVNNDMPQNDGSFVESNNLEPNKAANNADNVLRHIRNDPRANGNTLDKVTASDEALFNFRNQPTPETLQAARSSLEMLKKQLSISGAPQKQIIDVDRAINGLNKTQVDTGLTQNSDNPIKSTNLASKVAMNNANTVLRNIQNDPNSTRSSIDSVLASKRAINTFRTNPTPENLQAARSSLGVLKKQLVASGAPQKQIVEVNKTIDGFNKPSQSLSQKISTQAPSSTTVHSSNTQSFTKPRTTDKHVVHKVVDQVVNDKTQGSSNSDPIVRHHVQRIISNSSNSQTKRPIIDVNDKERIERVTTQKVMRPIINRNVNRVVTDNQLRGVISSLGPAAQNKTVAEPLRQLRRSENIAEVKKNIRTLQKAVRALNRSTKNKIDKKAFVDNLYNLQKPKNLVGGKD
ncbi:hypothetical protein [Lactobacillus johnsonii]|uniref:Uncharacterized protein n=1 Tax=Lactobacillus johnsonii TaxID=33959 RepID=A0A9X5AM75_LACJH|nr:hypothetical protein [Lactobacillus johnsonii]MTE03609.1 hypothetical protein [Lactobacillus johnsonii]